MKIRTKEQFQVMMDEESAWRIQELSYIRKLAHSVNDASPAARVTLRAAHALLYAHWEGWIKQVGKFYIEFVKGTRTPIKDLNYGLAGSAIRAEIRKLQESPKHAVTSEIAQFIIEQGLQERPKFGDDTIDTGSNLSSDLFEDIVLKLGLKPQKYLLRSNLIDAQLVKTRNEIAHGEHTRLKGDQWSGSPLLSPQGYIELHDSIVSTLQEFHNDVINAVAEDTYLRSKNNLSA